MVTIGYHQLNKEGVEMRYSIVPYVAIFLASFLILFLNLSTISFGSVFAIVVVSFMTASTITFLIFGITTVLSGKVH